MKKTLAIKKSMSANILYQLSNNILIIRLDPQKKFKKVQLLDLYLIKYYNFKFNASQDVMLINGFRIKIKQYYRYVMKTIILYSG